MIGGEAREHGMVLCEGKDDCAVFERIAEAKNATGLVFKDLGGKSDVTTRLKQIQASPDFTRGAIRRLLITRDADNSWEAAWQSLRDSTERVFGVSMTESGQWTKLNENCEVALWVAPGDQKVGMIETLCLEVLREQNPENFACLDQFAECLHQKEGGTLHEKEKFAILSLIAQEKEQPRQRLSVRRAIEHIPINWNHPEFNELASLIHEAAEFPPMDN